MKWITVKKLNKLLRGEPTLVSYGSFNSEIDRKIYNEFLKDVGINK